MSDNTFLFQWLVKLQNALKKRIAPEKIAELLQEGRNEVDSDRIQWLAMLVNRLEMIIGEKETQKVILDCACRYPQEDLQPMRKAYEETGDISVPHRMLQDRFESMLRNHLKLDEAMIEDVIGRGWGAAGVFDGNRVIATKIPKSGYLIEYMNEPDSQRRRQIYCHCPLIRDATELGIDVPVNYCYCGAGFYRGIWEEILQKPVHIEVVKSIMNGDDVCSFEIDLSE